MPNIKYFLQANLFVISVHRFRESGINVTILYVQIALKSQAKLVFTRHL